MSRPHEWKHERRNGAPTLRDRIARLAEDANALSLDLIAARDAAEPGDKAGWRYPLRQVERAAALLERAAK